VRRHLFWAAVALALAAAAHAAVVLYLPGWWFAREMAQLSRGHGANTFFILSPAQQAGLFPGLPRGGITGLCLFDLSAGDVTLSANVPDGLWIATIYTDRADVIYSVNNRQSGINAFSVRLSRAPGLIEQILSATAPESAEDIASGWTVMSPETRGLAVIWHPAPGTGAAALAADVMAGSRCTAQASGSG
jgi:uncharacterized membrane protein